MSRCVQTFDWYRIFLKGRRYNFPPTVPYPGMILLLSILMEKYQFQSSVISAILSLIVVGLHWEDLASLWEWPWYYDMHPWEWSLPLCLEYWEMGGHTITISGDPISFSDFPCLYFITMKSAKEIHSQTIPQRFARHARPVLSYWSHLPLTAKLLITWSSTSSLSTFQ